MNKLNFIFLIFCTYCLQCYAGIPNVMEKDEYYMEIAIQLAQQNPKVPFGSVIVDNETGKILGTGVNAMHVNPTFHGEIVAMHDCISQHPHIDWSKVTLYTTAEPCPMCQSAIIWAGIPKVLFATSIAYLKQHGWHQIDITAAEMNSKAPFYKGTLTGGVLAEKANVLYNR